MRFDCARLKVCTQISRVGRNAEMKELDTLPRFPFCSPFHFRLRFAEEEPVLVAKRNGMPVRWWPVSLLIVCVELTV